MAEFASGGIIDGPRGPGDDRIPVILTGCRNGMTPLGTPGPASLRRMRLVLDQHDSDLLLVGDTFDEGGRYVQEEIPRATSERWTWLEWDDAYDRLAQAWQRRTIRDEAKATER